MSSNELCSEDRTIVRNESGAIFVSLELSRSTRLITSLSPGGGQKMSRHQLRSGDVAGLFTRLSQLREKCQARTGRLYPLRVIHEAGLDGMQPETISRCFKVLEERGIIEVSDLSVIRLKSVSALRRIANGDRDAQGTDRFRGPDLKIMTATA